MTDFLYSDLEKMGMEELWGHPDEEIYELLFPPSHSKEIWKRYSNFVTLTNWREADVWIKLSHLVTEATRLQNPS